MSRDTAVVTLGLVLLAGTPEILAMESPSQEKRALAEALVARAEAAAGRGFAPGFRAGALGALQALDVEELLHRQGREGIGPLGGAAPSPRLVYTPVAPCRIADTRLAGGTLAPLVPRDFRVTGTDLSSQGGSATGCEVPFGPTTAVHLNFVAVNPVGPGNLRAWAYRSPAAPAPNASVLNFNAGSNLANGITVPVCDPAEAGQTCPQDLRVRADANGTHFVGDVVGYFTRELRPELASVQASVNTNLVLSTCTAVTGVSVTVQASGPGRVVLRAVVLSALSHTAGADDRMLIGIMPQPSNCAFPRVTRSIAPAQAPTGIYENTVPVTAEFTVGSAGSYTYHLNAVMSAGGMPDGSDQVLAAGTQMDATFYPDPPN